MKQCVNLVKYLSILIKCCQMSLSHVVGEPCEVDGEFRLSGGETQVEGLVEVCYEGLYSSICPRGLSVFNASFVCQELGFNGGKCTTKFCIILCSY